MEWSSKVGLAWVGLSMGLVCLSLQALLLSALRPHGSSLGDWPSIRLPWGPPTVANLARGYVWLFCSSLRLMTLPGFWPHPPTLVTVELCGSVGPAKGSKGWILDQALTVWCGGASDKSL